MSSKRRRGREAALQLLYASDIEGELTEGQTREEFWSLCTAKKSPKEFAETLTVGVLEHLDAIDAHIQTAVENYEFGRLAAVDRNLLRVAVYEMLYVEDVPDAVAINEAIEIAKEFGGPQSPKFVNGILDRIKRETTPASA